MNGEYIRAMKPEDFAALARKELSAAGIDPGLEAGAVFALMQPRTKLPADIVPAVTFFFTEDYEYDEKAIRKKLLKDGVFQTLEEIIEIFRELENFEIEPIDKALHEFVEQSGLGFGAVMPPIRIAVSGRQSGPDLAPILAILGKDTVLARIRRTIEQFG